MSDVADLTAPAVARVRAYAAPAGTAFDASGLGAFDVDAPGAPWTDLGWCAGFARRCGTKVEALVTGSPGFATGQVRTAVDAEVSLEFESWGKLQLALSCGAQQMNVLAADTNAVPVIVKSSSASSVDVGTAVSGFAVGEAVVVDVDYSGQTGLVGAGIPGGFVTDAVADVEYVRRVSLNVGRVAGVSGTVLELEHALLAGAPAAGMKVRTVPGFCDREGATFFQEWAGLFIAEGMQGDRVAWFYPRLQTTAGAAETRQELDGRLGTLRLAGCWRGLPVVDAVDGERVVCFRMYVRG